MPERIQDRIWIRLGELIEEWRPLEDALRTSDYPSYSLGFPDRSPIEVQSVYKFVVFLSIRFECSILIAEIAFEEIRAEFGEHAIRLLTSKG